MVPAEAVVEAAAILHSAETLRAEATDRAAAPEAIMTTMAEEAAALQVAVPTQEDLAAEVLTQADVPAQEALMAEAAVRDHLLALTDAVAVQGLLQAPIAEAAAEAVALQGLQAQ